VQYKDVCQLDGRSGRLSLNFRSSFITWFLENRSTVKLALALFAVNFLLRFSYYRYDLLIWDETAWAVSAQMWLGGKTLYSEIVIDKPPGATFIFALIFYLFGDKMIFIRLFTIIYVFATAVSIYKLGSYLYDRRLGWIGAFIYSVFSTTYFALHMIALNTELLLVLPYTLSVLFFLKGFRRQSNSLMLLAGVMTAIAMIFKPVGVFNLLLFAACLLLSDDRWTVRLRRLAVALLGLALGIGALVLYLAMTGALIDFWRDSILLNIYYVGLADAEAVWQYVSKRLSSYLAFNLSLFLLCGLAALRLIKSRAEKRSDKYSQEDLIVLIWAIASFMGVSAGRRFYGHYFIQLLPAASLLAARGLEIVKLWLGHPARRRIAWAFSCFLVLSFSVPLVRFHQYTFILMFEDLTNNRGRWSNAWPMTRDQKDIRQIADYVRLRTGPDEAVFMWGYRAGVYYHANRPIASKYLYNHMLTGIMEGPYSPAYPADKPPWLDARQALINELEGTQATYVIDLDAEVPITHYKDLARYLDDNYFIEHIEKLPGNRIVYYRRKHQMNASENGSKIGG